MNFEQQQVQDDYQRLQSALETLSEHFDAIQILATNAVHGDCQLFAVGAGNLFARQGMAQEFIDRSKSTARNAAILAAMASGSDD